MQNLTAPLMIMLTQSWIPAFAGMTDLPESRCVTPAKAGVQPSINVMTSIHPLKEEERSCEVMTLP